MSIRSLVAALITVFASGSLAAPAQAETINCTPINTIPAVISVPGVYCFTHDLVASVTSGNAIDIQANSVVLDMNGHRLDGMGGLSTQATGIHALNRQNVTVMNGTVSRFLIGILIEGSIGQGHLIEDVRADLNRMVGIGVGGQRSIIRNNHVLTTGGSTTAEFALGMIVDGSGNRVINNDVMVVFHSLGAAAGIAFEGAGNVDNLAVGNRITTVLNGIVIDGQGKYRDNLTAGVATPYTGGTDAGNNQ
jgi:hypothetical protein